MRIVLTGGAGFIGSCFLGKLNQEGFTDILVVDELNEAKWPNLANKKFTDYLEKDDFLTRITEKKIGPVDILVHLGACSSTIVTDEDYLINNNFHYSSRKHCKSYKEFVCQK